LPSRPKISTWRLKPTMRALTPKYVRMLLQTITTVNSVGECGFFTTPLPGGSVAAQTLTPVASAFKTAWDDLTTPAGPRKVRNAVALAISIPAGVHLWAGARFATGGNQPTATGVVHDVLSGHVLALASAAAFDGTTTYAGAIPAIQASAAVAPWLVAEMD
jgi:hypothetical protein